MGPRSICPCCASHDIFEIGKLPDSPCFAGTRLEEPIKGGWLYRCRTCKLKFRNPSESNSTYRSLYDNATTATWDAETSRADWDLIVRYLLERQPQGSRVLDFGCYTGGLLARLGGRYQRYGVEINRDAAAIASKKVGRNVWSSVDEIPSELRFDAVIATDVVEHVVNPLLLIKDLASKLSDDGILIITTGDADSALWNRFGANWWYCFYPEHISFLSASWLEYMSEVSVIPVVHCENFRYYKLSMIRRLLDLIFVHWYGLFPSSFLFVGRLIGRLRGRQDVTSLPGVGVSNDHLFIVLRRMGRP